MPPKNITSVARKSHIPSEAVSRCCSALAKWCSRAGLSCSACSARTGLSLKGHLFGQGKVLVVVGLPSDFRRLVEINRRGRRLSRPFEPRGGPGILARQFSVPQRPKQINHGQKISHGE